MTTNVREAWAEYAAASAIDHFAWWCATHAVQSIDQFAGLPLLLEVWQLEFMGEVLAVDEDGLPYWSVAGLVLPRKNGKTTLIGAYGTYHLDQSDAMPELLLGAGSDKQAGRMFDSVAAFIRRSEYLRSRLLIRDHVGEIVRKDGMGRAYRLASDPNRAHGYNPSRTAADELHGWKTPSMRRFWAAITTAGGARRDTQNLFISTAGEAEDREDGILGGLIDRNEARGEVERRPGLTISRNHGARTLIFNYHAPVDTKAPARVQRADRAAIRLANPASWVTDEYLDRQAEDPGLSDAEFLQLHANVWSPGAGAWLADRWDGLRLQAEVPVEGPAGAGVDIGLTDDSTAVSTAWRLADGRILYRSRVWSARPDVAAHVHVPGGRVRLEPVEEYLRELADEHGLTAIVYDPRFFEQNAQTLSDAGLAVVSLERQGKAWDDATNLFYREALADVATHEGDEVLAAHIKAIVAEPTERGWKLRKLKANRKIDAGVAAVMARTALEISSESVYNRKDLLVI